MAYDIDALLRDIGQRQASSIPSFTGGDSAPPPSVGWGGLMGAFTQHYAGSQPGLFGGAQPPSPMGWGEILQRAIIPGRRPEAPTQQQSSWPNPTPDRQPAAGSAAIPAWFSDLVWKHAPDDLQGNQEFLRTVAAGAKAESGWNPNRIQNGFTLGSGQGARGLFQFDMGGMGKPWLGNENALLGDTGAALQASQIVPMYADAFRRAPAGLTGADRASWVAAQAERPYDFQNPQSAARRNYATAYGEIQAANAAHTEVAQDAARTNAATGSGFNPATPAIRQTLDWTCSASSAAWLLNSMGIPATEQSVVAGLGPRINSRVGLTDASGSGLASYLQEKGISARSANGLTFDQVKAIAGQAPMMIGGLGWNHWTGVSGVDGDTLILANPAPGYRGVGRTLTRQQFNALGAFNGVWVQ